MPDKKTPTIGRTLEGAVKKLTILLKNTDQAWMEAEILLASVLKKDRTWLLAHGEATLNDRQARAFGSLLRRRLRQEPMAYLTNVADFCGRDFFVDRRVLIPRPETEELVERATKRLQATKESFLVWDVGVGSGAIAVTIKAKTASAMVIASDVSTDALIVAKRNAKHLLGSTKLIRWITSDLLSKRLATILTRQKSDRLLVVANLPYLPLSDRKVLAPSVTKFEPARALFTKENGNFLIHKLLQQLAVFRLKDGRPLTILAEFDPPQATPLRSLAFTYFPDATIAVHPDSCGRERILEIAT